MTPEEKEKLLIEEKEYWQKEALLAREAAAGARCVADAQARTAEELDKAHTEALVRLALIADIQRAMQKTGAPLSDWALGGVTVDCLERILAEAREYEKPPGKGSTDGFKQIGWRIFGDQYCGRNTKPASGLATQPVYVKISETPKK